MPSEDGEEIKIKSPRLKRDAKTIITKDACGHEHREGGIGFFGHIDTIQFTVTAVD